MGNSQNTGTPVDSAENIADSQSVLMSADDFDQRWKVFLQSLDISSGHVKHVESLDKQKKIELLLSFEAKNPLCNVAASINLLRNLDWNQILCNSKKRDSGSTLRSLLSSVEISLRTNSVDWVYEFLQCNGIEMLSDFMATCLHLLSSSHERIKRHHGNSSCDSPYCHRSRNLLQSFPSGMPSFDYSFCLPSENGELHGRRYDVNMTTAATNNTVTCGPLRQPLSDNIKDLLKDCLHLSLRCFKTILNNQNGCKRAFEYPQVIQVLTFCLLHPSFMTKALALDLLTALCLIEGGHIKVLQAFDHLRQVMGEGLRFEMLLDSFKHHESLDVEEYNIDFAVACVQFFNIVVHSPENINLRVYLQYELYLLGLDEVLKKLKDRAGDRLMQHIEAYLDNRVDCSLLLEDAEAKETAVAELERLESEVVSKVTAAKEAARVEAEAAFKARELELSELVESLRSRIRDLNVASWDRENAMKRRVDELQQTLHAARAEITQLKTALDTLKETTTSSGKICTSMATSTHFDTDVNGTEPELGDNVSSQTPNQPKRSVHVGTGPEAKPIQPSLSVDRTSRVRHELPVSTKSSSTDRKAAFHQVHNGAPQKPHRKQMTIESAASEKEQPSLVPDYQGCPNNTVVRSLAAEAATTLSRLVSNNATNTTILGVGVHPPYFIVPPSGWPYHTSILPQSETLFGTEALRKSLSLHPLNDQLTGDSNPTLDAIWYRHWERLPGPWLLGAQQTNSLFPIPQADSPCSNQMDSSHSVQWLVDLGLLPVNIDELSSTMDQSSNVESLVQSWKLYRSLVQCTVPPITAQRLLWELHLTLSPRIQSYLFDQIEHVLAQRFGSKRHPDWSFHALTENRWFWISSLLRISLLWQLFPAELQRLTEGLSSLLAGCTSVLVNSKLPIILQLAILFAQRSVANWNTDTFELAFLDALLDWKLSGLTVPSSTFHPPVNGGPPAYQAPGTPEDRNTGSGCKSSRSSHSFMAAFVHLVFQVAPNLMDWHAELTHIDAASRISIEDVVLRVKDMQTALDVWHVISVIPLTNLGIEESGSPDRSQVQSIMQEIDQQLTGLRLAVDSTRVVVQAAAYWLRASTSCGNQSPPVGWLGPLVRFCSAFKRCASDLEKKQRNTSVGSESTLGAASSHKREHRRPKNEKSHVQYNGEKSDHRRRKHRTRQLDSDGIMDDILAGLTCQPLRTDIHTKRKDKPAHKESQ